MAVSQAEGEFAAEKAGGVLRAARMILLLSPWERS
jgi:hypothetical protein